MSAGLELRGLRVVRGGRLLCEVSLEAPPGLVSVLGARAGAGLSSLAAAVAGALPAAGEVRLDGRALSGPPGRRRRLGLAAVLPDVGVPGGVTVIEALALAAGSTRAAWIGLEQLPQLADRSALRTERLSGGERQLLRVALGLAGTPRAVVLDDPLPGLAEDAAAAVASLVTGAAGRGAAVLWLTADAAGAPAAATLWLVDGEVRVSATATAAARQGTASPPPAASEGRSP